MVCWPLRQVSNNHSPPKISYLILVCWPLRQVPNFIALYALTFFFANWGPNSITYILPSELFPARQFAY